MLVGNARPSAGSRIQAALAPGRHTGPSCGRPSDGCHGPKPHAALGTSELGKQKLHLVLFLPSFLPPFFPLPSNLPKVFFPSLPSVGLGPNSDVENTRAQINWFSL